jgi:hypothetical protein
LPFGSREWPFRRGSWRRPSKALEQATKGRQAWSGFRGRLTYFSLAHGYRCPQTPGSPSLPACAGTSLSQWHDSRKMSRPLIRESASRHAARVLPWLPCCWRKAKNPGRPGAEPPGGGHAWSDGACASPTVRPSSPVPQGRPMAACRFNGGSR